MPKLTSLELEKEITEQFKFGHNVKYLSEYYNIPMLRIHRILKRNGIDKIPKNMLDITLDDEKRICELYLKGFSTCDIADVFFQDTLKSDITIAKSLRKNNIELRNFGAENKVFNDSFFDIIDTEHKAYWLGFIYADGNIRIDKNNTHMLQIELEQQDDYILKDLVHSLQVKQKVKDYENETVTYIDKELNYFSRENRFENYSKIYDGCSIQINSERIYNGLLLNGVNPNKTLNMNIPKISDYLLPHFIRGYFDGDGSFSCNRITFYGQHNLLQYIKDNLSFLCLNDNKIFDKKKEKVSMLSYGKKSDVIILYNYLYQDATIYLKRKYKELSIYVGTEVTN